tara:strand:- start:99 stop:839 length:741 start_codon:yes stop_codon:yes gene_type:complete
MAFKMKGFSPFTQYDPVKKPVGPVTPSTKAEYMNREVWNLVEKQKAGDFDKSTEYHSFKPKTPKMFGPESTVKKSPLKQKPKDDDTDRMTDEEHKAHVKKVSEYNKKNKTFDKHPNKQGLIKKIEKAAKENRIRIDSLSNKDSLSEDEKARLKELKRTYSDHQTMLHDLRGGSPMKQGADAAEMRRYKRYKRTGKIADASKGNERQGMSEEKRFKTYGKMYDEKARGQKEQKKINRQRRRQARFSG